MRTRLRSNKDEQWLSSHEAHCKQNDKRVWKHYLPLRSVTIEKDLVCEQQPQDQ